MLNAECAPLRAPCEAQLACIEGKCSKPLATEMRCESSACCNQLAGQTCAAPSSNDEQRVCAPQPVAQPNETCGKGEEVTRMCSGGPANCRPDSGGGLHCVQPAKDGEACGEQAGGRTCIAPARCLAGHCRLGAIEGC
jgi:hypothetical protein